MDDLRRRRARGCGRVGSTCPQSAPRAVHRQWCAALGDNSALLQPDDATSAQSREGSLQTLAAKNDPPQSPRSVPWGRGKGLVPPSINSYSHGVRAAEHEPTGAALRARPSRPIPCGWLRERKGCFASFLSGPLPTPAARNRTGPFSILQRLPTPAFTSPPHSRPHLSQPTGVRYSLHRKEVPHSCVLGSDERSASQDSLITFRRNQ